MPTPSTESRRQLLIQQLRVREIHKANCFIGDVAREHVSSYDDRTIDILNAVTETAFALGHRFELDANLSLEELEKLAAVRG